MNERIKELAEQAGLKFSKNWGECYTGNVQIERFAELVRQDEREKCAADYLEDCARAVEQAEQLANDQAANSVSFSAQHTEMLKLDLKGFHYKGQVIEDAGEAYKRFGEWLSEAEKQDADEWYEKALWGEKQAALDGLAETSREIEQEPVAHAVIAGVLFDFMGWLTSRQNRLVLSSCDDASPAVEVIDEFAKMRGLSLDDAKVKDWQCLTAPPKREIDMSTKPEKIDTSAERVHEIDKSIQEPAGYLCENAVGHKYFRWKKPMSAYKPIALYTVPPKREWQDLTHEEVMDAYCETPPFSTYQEAFFAGIRFIEAKLKEKNDATPLL